jgi:hypothetical protein
MTHKTPLKNMILVFLCGGPEKEGAVALGIFNFLERIQGH